MTVNNSLNYMPHIDGLRGIAVLVILLFHLDITQVGGGFSGVDIFFVISGYLITSIITKEMAAGTFSFADFYARRVRRIFPALFVMLAVSSVAAIVFLGPHHFYEFFRSVRYAAAQASNFLFSRDVDYFAIKDEHPPLLHTWSLGVEEQFYLMWPLLLLGIHNFLGLGKSLLVLSLLLIASLVVSEYLVVTDARQAFYHLHARAWELALGGILSLSVLPSLQSKVWANGVSGAGLVLIGLSAFLLKEEGFPGSSALAPCVGAAMVIYAGQGVGSKILSFKPLVWVGLISYSLYLWHWPIITFYKGYFGAGLSYVEQASLAAVSFIAAILSYKFVEIPTRKLAWPSRRILIAGFTMIGLFIVASNVLKNANDAPWRLHVEMAEDLRWPHELDKICASDGGAEDKDQCIIGPNKDKYEVILAGDSHASHYTPMILAWAAQKGLTVRLYMRGACKSWLDKEEVAVKDGKPDYMCKDLSDGFFETLKNDPSIKYVFLGGYMPDTSDDTRRSIEMVKEAGKKVYFLGQTPVLAEDPHECFIRQHLLISRWFPQGQKNCFAINSNCQAANVDSSQADFREMLKEYKIPYFNPVPFLNNGTDEQGHFMFRDTNHLNRYGALHLTPAFTRFMDNQDDARKSTR